MLRPPCLLPPLPPPPSSSGSSSVPPVTVKPEPFSSASPVVHGWEIGRAECDQNAVWRPALSHRGRNSQMLAHETEIYRNIFISLPFSPKVRETTFGREKDCPCSFAGTPPYTHFWHVSLPTPLHTEHKHSLENSKHSSIHDAVLGGSQQVAVTGGPDSNSRFVCKGATVRGSRRKSSGLGEPQFL